MPAPSRLPAYLNPHLLTQRLTSSLRSLQIVESVRSETQRFGVNPEYFLHAQASVDPEHDRSAGIDLSRLQSPAISFPIRKSTGDGRAAWRRSRTTLNPRLSCVYRCQSPSYTIYLARAKDPPGRRGLVEVAGPRDECPIVISLSSCHFSVNGPASRSSRQIIEGTT
jgi:hypothetical protein